MINETLLPKAYREVLEILKYIPKADYDKVPKYIIENMEKEQDTTYEYVVSNFENFNNQEMLKETENILAVLFRDYWATEDERMIILAREQKEKRELEKEKYMNYKPLNDMFTKEEPVVKVKENPTQLVEVKQSFWNKLISEIKKILHIS